MTNSVAQQTDGTPLARRAALAAGALLGAIGALHAVWAAGSPWPFGDREALSQTVWGDTASTFPPPAATLVVVVLLWTAAALVIGRGGLWRVPLPWWMFSVGTWAVAVVLFLRVLLLGTASLGSDAQNRTWELAVFSPLCLVIAVLCVVVAKAGPRSVVQPDVSPALGRVPSS